MSDATSLLYDLPGFAVVSVEPMPGGGRQVVIMQSADEHACPRCGVLVGGRPFDVRPSRVKDLPVGHRRVEVIWRKRRYRCRESVCAQRVFVERSVQIPPRHRLTGRLRARLELHQEPRTARGLRIQAAAADLRITGSGSSCGVLSWGRVATAGRRGQGGTGGDRGLHDGLRVVNDQQGCGWCRRRSRSG